MHTIFAIPLDIIAIFVLGFGLLALAGLRVAQPHPAPVARQSP
jgi:hypothetical protein